MTDKKQTQKKATPKKTVVKKPVIKDFIEVKDFEGLKHLIKKISVDAVKFEEDIFTYKGKVALMTLYVSGTTITLSEEVFNTISKEIIK